MRPAERGGRAEHDAFSVPSQASEGARARRPNPGPGRQTAAAVHLSSHDARPSAAHAGPPAPRWPILALMTLSQAGTSSNALVLGPLAPFLMDEYGLDRASVGLAVSALYASTAGVSLLAGWLNDRLGVRRTLAFGQLALGAAILVATRAPTFAVLLASLLVAGLGYSVVAPATTKALVDWFPAPERGMAVAVKQTGFTLGGASAAAFAPALALAAGWRVALGVVGALPAVLGLATLALYRDRAAAPAAPVHSVQVDRRQVRDVLTDPALVALAVAAILLGMQQAAVVAYSVLFLHEGVGMDLVGAGWLLAAMQAAGTATRLGFGWLSDRQFLHRRLALVVACSAIGAAGSAAFATLSPASPPVWVALATMAAGAGGLGWVGLLMVVVAERAGAGRAALGVGMSTTFVFIGFVIGPPVFGAIAARAGFSAAWLFAAGLLLLTLVPLNLSAARSRQHREALT